MNGNLVAGKVVVHEEAGQQRKPALDDVFRSHAVGRILHSVLEVLHQTGCSGFTSGSRIVARRLQSISIVAFISSATPCAGITSTAGGWPQAARPMCFHEPARR